MTERKKPAPRATSASMRSVALLRGINVGGQKKIAMPALCKIAEELGLSRVATYIQSGNLVYASPLDAPEVESALESAIRARFGFDVSVIVRSADAWTRYAADETFADAALARPKMLHLALAKAPIAADAIERLSPYAKAGERIARASDDALWLDFNESVGRSKLTPAVLDRCVGSPVTARNWSTVQALFGMLSSDTLSLDA